jgi:hypothetical protein
MTGGNHFQIERLKSIDRLRDGCAGVIWGMSVKAEKRTLTVTADED